MKCVIAGILALALLAGVEFAALQRLDAIELESALKSPNTIINTAEQVAPAEFLRGLKSFNTEVLP